MDPADKSEIVASLDAMTFNEIQLVLAEKRTALSTLRTGVAIFAFPLSVLSVLIATSKAYKIEDVLQWMIPLLLLNLGLIILAIYLISLAIHRIRHYDRLILGFKRKYGRLAELLD
ncbi:MAG TPA: hypothetical protein VG347_08360 [Verrucomicrobiae bacterium]|nr:hypothetical protein [Verrucomicrobiae bacterium]